MSFAILGVQVFFVISGFLITTLLLKEHEKTSTISLKDFYIRRAYRILPAAAVYMIPIFLSSGMNCSGIRCWPLYFIW